LKGFEKKGAGYSRQTRRLLGAVHKFQLHLAAEAMWNKGFWKRFFLRKSEMSRGLWNHTPPTKYITWVIIKCNKGNIKKNEMW
jgi:hypothetical protein